MNFFYIWDGKSIKKMGLIIVFAFFAAWFLYIGNIVHMPAFSTKDGPKAVYKGEKDLALTFNIGWGDEKAEPILDVLQKENVKSATFFLSGSWAERHPDLVARIVKEGFEIGILGYNYEDYSDLEDAKIRQDLAKAQVVFKKLNVKDIKLVRAPTGHFDQRTLIIAERLGYSVVHWSIDSKDWTNPGIEEIVNNVSRAKKGDIILLHASDAAKQTAKALPAIINNINKKGLKLVTVSEMLANAETRTKEIK
ncbi:polysaccharide deacetylase family sporulation protein PdaB [Bacillus sp. DTU_2020_1000418_1_SI_GHA_SEK_038]|uniref:polysaccharide deacetylase family sporulation protein PdaB n=1 Tax=Bacillus sp. DTU_2020_1000418_1_SI_GHA_SEK_038 TaxID=3077585 RepID=UPI0028E8D301|nr:polysaccharide deacetylase family sporulation protein PdaB [Bacillus sp. DTU_2020_1000418_1_SI_GHA_SEK_038]WNS77505.1 polysaccharide deacetylase family sporulation protein PdaB [Bacillus sp. DTU_2020_1000418_1_SI_GHA_SEK_038]